MPLPNRPRAVVTGAGSGLGRAFCVELAKRGARLIVSDIDLAQAQATVALLDGVEAHAVACDVSKLAEVEALAAAADRFFGGTDLLINNAGVAVAGRVGTVPVENWAWIIGINQWGPIHGCHVFVPRFLSQKSGHVINVASAAGLLSPPEMGPYNVTKAAVIALSETLYAELSPSGIGVTVLCPTYFKTNINSSARATGTDERMRKFIDERMAKGKLQANDVARIALAAADARELYVVPQADGRWFWRLKRAAPESFNDLSRRVIAAVARRQGARRDDG